MTIPIQVIALAGVGNLGRYICEELIKDKSFDVVVLSRHVIIYSDIQDTSNAN